MLYALRYTLAKIRNTQEIGKIILIYEKTVTLYSKLINSNFLIFQIC